jgi:hypothetical protein
MKKLLLFLLLVLSTGCSSKRYNNVVIEVCKPRLLGCANRLIIENKNFLIAPTNKKAAAQYEALTNQMTNNKKFKETLPSIDGYTTKEKGHFPNPMASFDVFKLDDLTPPETK